MTREFQFSQSSSVVSNITEDMDNDGVEDAMTPTSMEMVFPMMWRFPTEPKGFFIDKQPTQFNKRNRFFYDSGKLTCKSYWTFTGDPDFNSSLPLAITPNYPEDLNPSIWLDADDHESIIKSLGVEQWRTKAVMPITFLRICTTADRRTA